MVMLYLFGLSSAYFRKGQRCPSWYGDLEWRELSLLFHATIITLFITKKLPYFGTFTKRPAFPPLSAPFPRFAGSQY